MFYVLFISINEFYDFSFRNCEFGFAPFFLFGDFNFRTDTKAVIMVKFF